MNKIAIVGLGYVGLPLSIQFARAGVKVLGLDIDTKKVEAINQGQSYIKHIPSEAIGAEVGAGNLRASTNFSLVQDVQAVIICVPTPLNKNREPDISYILDTGRAIAPYLRRAGGNVRWSKTAKASEALALAGSVSQAQGDGDGGALALADGMYAAEENATAHRVPASAGRPLVVLESTTYPGTTEEDLREVLEKGSGLKAGIDFHLAFSPEREDPGNPDSKVALIPKVVGGLTPECGRRACELYRQAIQTLVPVSSCRVAEAVKILENTFRSINIALVNELKMVYAAMNIDIWEVINAAKTKPFGFMAFYPGPGLGGHCIPIDPFYLTWKAREYNQNTRFIELAGEINTRMPEYVVGRVTEALNSQRKPLNGSKILLLGIAYKPNVDDDRESPSYVLLNLLRQHGATVGYHDPYVPVIRPTREHPQWAGLNSVELTPEEVEQYDAVVIATNHAGVDYALLAQHARVIVDTRNAMAEALGPNDAAKASKVWKA